MKVSFVCNANALNEYCKDYVRCRLSEECYPISGVLYQSVRRPWGKSPGRLNQP